jgi:hypothetical protein
LRLHQTLWPLQSPWVVFFSRSKVSHLPTRDELLSDRYAT